MIDIGKAVWPNRMDDWMDEEREAVYEGGLKTWAMTRVLNRYGITCFWVTGHAGMGMVPNLGTCVKTIPLTTVSWVFSVATYLVGA